VTKKQ